MYSSYGQQQHRGSSRGKDPSGLSRGGRPAGNNPRSHSSNSSNILEELQSIEQALSMASHSSTVASHNYNSASSSKGISSSDWHDNNTPPRHNRSINRSNNSNNTSASRDPPLSNEKQNSRDFYQQRFGSGNSENTRNKPATNPRSPLVRFSEQLEVYSKHVTCAASASPAPIPILRSKNSNSSTHSRTKSPIPPQRNNQPTPNNHQQRKTPSSGGSRDPTPRASIGGSPAEPAGISKNTRHATAIPLKPSMSDPPVDRSKRLLASPAGLRQQPSSRSIHSEPRSRRQGQNGSLSLYHQNSNNNSSSWSSASKAQQPTYRSSSNDLELNPRRLANDFSNVPSTKLRQDLAPTPRNKNAEQAPTPNQNWVLGKAMAAQEEKKQQAAPPKTWSMASLFGNPCQSPFTTATTNNNTTAVKPAMPPVTSVALAAHNEASRGIPSHLSIPSSSLASSNKEAAPTPIRERTEKQQQRWQEQDDDNTSVESASALLIHHTTKDQWERGPILTPRSDIQEDDVDESDEEEVESMFSQATPSSLREMLESRDDLPVMSRMDSNFYEKSSSASRKNSKKKTDRRNQASYLQLGDDGSLQQNSVGTEIKALPTSIEVRIEDSFGATSSNVEDTKPQSEQMTQDCMGGVLQRFRSKQIPFQELDGDVFSYNESFDIDSQGNEYIIKKATSDTEETDSGIHLPGKGSSWDRFDRDDASDCDDDDILISSSHKRMNRRRRKPLWIVWVLVCTIVVCLAVGLPLYFFYPEKEDQPDSTLQAPSESPIPSEPIVSGKMDYDTCILLHGDHASDYSERYFAIRQLLRLMSVGRTSLIDEPETPQRKALCWIAEDDSLNIDISDGNEFAVIQRYTLAVVYHSLAVEDDGFADSLSNTDFLSATHECEWDVIMCSKPGVVSALLMSDKNLSGKLPPEVGNLEGLTFLELSLNQMKGSIPSAIQQLTALEYLALSFNELSGSIPSVLGRMTSLQYLNMRSSQIVGTIPSELGNLSKLESLLLEGNKLTGTIPSSLGNLHQSQQMSFRRNYLSGRVAVELCELRDFGELVELTVDYWIACDCCTSM